MRPERAVAYRKQAAALLEGVVNDQLPARTALNCWPVLGNEDPSVQCAYTMLWYLEADEDRHFEEPFYADIQLKVLAEAAQLLKQGEPLPAAWLAEYGIRQAPPEYMDSWLWRHPLWWWKKQLRRVRFIVETHPVFAKKPTP